ncbi:MAG: carboxymuconolactone decarboxylase family protein [Proteobacteria bacterium]|nr:MAG: carboxymuconolactone decarboxylase family protein [Pseudomonadota bacterium]
MKLGRAIDSADFRADCRELFGHVPSKLKKRFALAEATGRTDAIAAIEAWREELLQRNPLDRKIHPLAYFALLIGASEADAARLHAQEALKAGATVCELFGVAETPAITDGMPAFSLAVEIFTDAI